MVIFYIVALLPAALASPAHIRSRQPSLEPVEEASGAGAGASFSASEPATYPLEDSAAGSTTSLRFRSTVQRAAKGGACESKISSSPIGEIDYDDAMFFPEFTTLELPIDFMEYFVGATLKSCDDIPLKEHFCRACFALDPDRAVIGEADCTELEDGTAEKKCSFDEAWVKEDVVTKLTNRNFDCEKDVGGTTCLVCFDDVTRKVCRKVGAGWDPSVLNVVKGAGRSALAATAFTSSGAAHTQREETEDASTRNVRTVDAANTYATEDLLKDTVTRKVQVAPYWQDSYSYVVKLILGLANQKAVCTGVLVKSSYIITAAHCVPKALHAKYEKLIRDTSRSSESLPWLRIPRYPTLRIPKSCHGLGDCKGRATLKECEGGSDCVWIESQEVLDALGETDWAERGDLWLKKMAEYKEKSQEVFETKNPKSYISKTTHDERVHGLEFALARYQRTHAELSGYVVAWINTKTGEQLRDDRIDAMRVFKGYYTEEGGIPPTGQGVDIAVMHLSRPIDQGQQSCIVVTGIPEVDSTAKDVDFECFKRVRDKMAEDKEEYKEFFKTSKVKGLKLADISFLVTQAGFGVPPEQKHVDGKHVDDDDMYAGQASDGDLKRIIRSSEISLTLPEEFSNSEFDGDPSSSKSIGILQDFSKKEKFLSSFSFGEQLGGDPGDSGGGLVLRLDSRCLASLKTSETLSLGVEDVDAAQPQTAEQKKAEQRFAKQEALIALNEIRIGKQQELLNSECGMELVTKEDGCKVFLVGVMATQNKDGTTKTNDVTVLTPRLRTWIANSIQGETSLEKSSECFTPPLDSKNPCRVTDKLIGCTAWLDENACEGGAASGIDG